MVHRMALAALFVGVSLPVSAETQCFGEAGYRVSTETYVGANGDLNVRSYDSEGNSYSLGTESRSLPGGGQEIISRDSEGNSYSLRSWTDSSGAHSVDSEGNSCTITYSGSVIGCGP